MSDDVSFLSQLVRDSMEQQAQEKALVKTDDQKTEVMKPLQVYTYVLLEQLFFNSSSENRKANLFQCTFVYGICCAPPHLSPLPLPLPPLFSHILP